MKKTMSAFLGIIFLASHMAFAAGQPQDKVSGQTPAMLVNETANEIRHIP